MPQDLYSACKAWGEQNTDALVQYDREIRSVLGMPFKSDFFKKSMFKHVKNPVEMVDGTLRKTGEFRVPVGADKGIFAAM